MTAAAYDSRSGLAAEGIAICIERLSVGREPHIFCRVRELQVAVGMRLGIYGGNGFGKSTLLRVLAGLEKRYHGQCEVAASVRDRVYVHQTPYLFRGTVRSNVEYGLRARAVFAAERNSQSDVWMERLGITALANRAVDRLSGGERRRVALARACVLDPALLLLDEPLADLDEDGVECVRNALQALDRATVLIASPAPLPEGLVQQTWKLTRQNPID